MKELDHEEKQTTVFDLYYQEISSADERKLVPVFDKVTEIKTVRYANQLLSRVTSGEIKTLLRTEFEKQEAKNRGQDFYRFTNNLFIADYIKSQYSNAIKNQIPIGDKLFEKQVIDFLQGKKSVDFIICNMGASGSGVFANNEISQNTFMTFYNGQLSSVLSYKKSFPNLIYAFYGITGVPLYTPAMINSEGRIVPLSLNECKPFVISAHQYGNYGTFFQHLPNPESLSKLGLPPEYSRYIATANLKMTSFDYQGFPLIILSASRKINAGEQVGYDYSDNPKIQYWSTQNTFSLFNRRGEEIVGVTDGKILPKDIKELSNKVLMKELVYHTFKVKPALENLWKANKDVCFITAEKTSLSSLIEQFGKMDIEIRFSKLKNSDNYCLIVRNSAYQKFLKFAENEDLTPKLQ